MDDSGNRVEIKSLFKKGAADDRWKKLLENEKKKREEAETAKKAAKEERMNQIEQVISSHAEIANLMPDERAPLLRLLEVKKKKEAKYNELMEALGHKKPDKRKIIKLVEELIDLTNELIEILNGCNLSSPIIPMIIDTRTQLEYQRDDYLGYFLNNVLKLSEIDICIKWETKNHNKYTKSRRDEELWDYVRNNPNIMRALADALPIR